MVGAGVGYNPSMAVRDTMSLGETVSADAAFQAANAALTAEWDVRGIDIATVHFVRGTAMRPIEGGGSENRVRALPSLLAPGPQGASPQFRIGDVLGEGGMGVVRVAEQIALDREVAVKTLKPQAGRGEAPQLLREARVTGVLEHPNVVPVYALGRDNEDRPLLVMKRITGRSWGSILDEVPKAERLDDDFLRQHLAILKQVALAVHYAHAKGFIHRDLKPENVMIGGFGEVYLVDWGIAVSKRPGEGVPVARECTAIEGTPAYMAPEMAAGDGEHIDERTDVYLLGAVLHEIITGEPPHSGRTIMQVLTHAFASAPHDYRPEVPRDLAAICHRAMARFNDDRYPDAAAFADALDEFIAHRSSTQLSDEARDRLEEARAIFARRDEPSSVGGAERQGERIYALLSESRFAFSQALRSWPENEAAIAGLQATLELMIEHELARDAPMAAASIVPQLPRDNPSLAARVARAVDRKKKRDAELLALAHDVDASIGAGTRRIISTLVATLWGVGCVVCGLLTRSGIFEVTPRRFAVICAACGAILLLSAILRREDVLTTAVNRRLAVVATVAFAGYSATWLYAGVLGLAMYHGALMQQIFSLMVWTVAGLTINRSWLFLAGGAVVGMGLILLFPAYCLEAFGVTGAVTSALASWRSQAQAAQLERAPITTN
jgi:serine/threonine-protein kinase